MRVPPGIRTACVSALMATVAVAPVLVRGAVASDAQLAATPAEVPRTAAFGDPLPGLSGDQRQAFDTGFQLFIKTWTRAEGLGPSVNAENCISCHAEPMPGGSGTESRTFVTHLSGPPGRPSPAAVFQRFSVDSPHTLIPRPLPAAATLRRTPPLFGLGLLEAVPVDDLLRHSELNRERTDGVGGRLVRIDGAYCRFGWNGNFATIDEVVSFALFAEMGLTNAAHPRGVNRQGVEVRAEQVRSVAEFIRFLAPPPRRNAGAAAAQGEQLFSQASCTACHRASLRTDPAAPAPLGNRVISPYTDLLVHDMGDDAGRSIRTPPLWGLSSTGPPFLHDGRARTAQEAILLHAGEATASVAAFKALSRAEQALLLEFLNSL